MSGTGQPATSLKERLSAKAEANRMEVEALTLAEQRKLAQSLNAALQAEFATIRSVIEHERERTAPLLAQMLRVPLWTTAGCLVIVLVSCLMLWLVTFHQRQELNEIQATLDQLEMHGVEFTRSEKGVFVEFPVGTSMTVWTCRRGAVQHPCIRLGKNENANKSE